MSDPAYIKRRQRFNTELGANIRTARLAAGVTLAQLGSKIGKRDASIVRIENGQNAPISAFDVVAIAAALNIPIAMLFEPLSADTAKSIGEARAKAVVLRSFDEIKHPALQAALVRVIAVCSELPGPAGEVPTEPTRRPAKAPRRTLAKAKRKPRRGA